MGNLGITINGILLIILGVVMLLGGIAGIVGGTFLGGLGGQLTPEMLADMQAQGVSADEAQAMAGAFSGVFTAVGAVLAIVGIVEIITGVFVFKRKSWARILGSIFAVLTLLAFPVGTIIGIIMLYLFWFHKDTKAAFAKA